MIGDGLGVLKAVYTPGAWQGQPTLQSFFRDRELDATLTNPEITQQLTNDELEKFNVASDRFVQKALLPFTIECLDVLTYFPCCGAARARARTLRWR